MKIGIVSDFVNYKEYFNKYMGENTDKVLEIHLLENDIDENFEKKLLEFKQFALSKNIEHISFHTPDKMMQNICFKEEGCEESNKKLKVLIGNLKEFGDCLKREIILVVHQGIKIEEEKINLIGDISKFRNDLLKKSKISYMRLKNLVKGSYITIAIENSPPICLSDKQIHFLDLGFEELKDRLKEDGAFVLDISHAAICIQYFKQNKIKYKALELLRDKEGNPPKSLRSLIDYVKTASNNIKWIHINDTNGLFGEGNVIGVDNSLINFKDLLKTINGCVKSPVGVIEVLNSHKDYNLIKVSLDNLKKYLNTK